MTVLDPGPISPAMGLALFCEQAPDASFDSARLLCSMLAMEFLMKSMLCSSATGGYQHESRMSQPRVMFGSRVSFRLISSMVRRKISIRCIPYCSHICTEWHRNTGTHKTVHCNQCVTDHNVYTFIVVSAFLILINNMGFCSKHYSAVLGTVV